MDHDMTFDRSSRLGVPTEPGASANSRTPAFDLDSVYGDGPHGPDAVFFVTERGRRGRAIKFKVESGGAFEDVPRDADAKAIISDPRNDENLLISGLQVAFFKFHNNAVDFVERNEHEHDDDEIFRRARRLTTWHYQWMIVHEFLPLFIGHETLDDILRGGRKFYRPQVAQIPVEFQAAAYRFGHSMVRPSYRANLARENGQPFFGMIFDSAAEGQADPVDLRGGARARRRFVGWQTFFNFGSSPRPSGDGHAWGRREAEQADRHEDLDTTVQPAAGGNRVRSAAHGAAPAQSAASDHVDPAGRPEDRRDDGGRLADARSLRGAEAIQAEPRSVDAALVLHPQRS
jgi:hypothetical protein